MVCLIIKLKVLLYSTLAILKVPYVTFRKCLLMTSVAVKSTAVSILLLTLAHVRAFQNSDVTHMRLNVTDGHHVDSSLASFINSCLSKFQREAQHRQQS